MKKILICGSTGFIGRNVAEALASRPDLEIFGTYFSSPPLNHPRVHPVHANLTLKSDVERAIQGMDIVIQAAAATSGVKDIVNRPYIHVTDNALMNSLLLRAAFDHSVSHFVFFSCSVMYPSAATPISEDGFNSATTIHPRYFGVGWTKVYVEKMCEFYAGLGRTRHTVIRHSNIYGPHDKYDLDRSHVFGATVAKVMQATRDAIVVWGNGNEARDLLYVEDLVNFVRIAIARQTTPFELINVGSGLAVSIRELVEKIILASGKKVKVSYDLSKPSIDMRLCLDTSRAREIFGWSPNVSLEEGIAKTLNWYAKEFKQGS